LNSRGGEKGEGKKQIGGGVRGGKKVCVAASMLKEMAFWGQINLQHPMEDQIRVLQNPSPNTAQQLKKRREKRGREPAGGGKIGVASR